jgi:hypothetical protein
MNQDPFVENQEPNGVSLNSSAQLSGQSKFTVVKIVQSRVLKWGLRIGMVQKPRVQIPTLVGALVITSQRQRGILDNESNTW